MQERLPGASGELVQLIVDYAKQETVGPLKGLVRSVGFGVAGAVAVSVGATLLLIALLRLMQSETGSTFTGNLSWIPYLIVSFAAVLVLALSAWRITKGPAKRSVPVDREGS